MAPSVHVRRSTTYTITLDDDTEVEVQFEPEDHLDILSERVGDKLVVGYLSSDDDGQSCNPMDNDCQGHIYTDPDRRNHIVTDDASSLREALHVDSYGNPDIDERFNLNHENVTLRELARRDFVSQHPELVIDPDNGKQRDSAPDDEEFHAEHGDTIEQMAVDLYRKHWRSIVGALVVPISYQGERGGVIMSTVDWDGDPDDLPDGVWVADKGAEENIRSSLLPEGVTIEWKGALGSETEPLHAVVTKDGVQVGDFKHWHEALAFTAQFGLPGPNALTEAATAYAEGVVTEYASWAEGDVHGVCVEVFVKEDDSPGWKWERATDDAVWGHIGSDWAEQALKEEFDHTVAGLKNAGVAG